MSKKTIVVTAAHIAVLTATVVPLLFAFSSKPFHMDDPMYVWAARQIMHKPWDFYGLTVNWTMLPLPFYEIMQNPPGVSYFLAMIGHFRGFSEQALHIGFIAPALVFAYGTYFLARRFTSYPLLAALASFATPALMVSATTLMSDVSMLAFWVWAVFFWVKGTDDNRPVFLALAGFLIALATLTKYFGAALIPLLSVYSISKGKKGLSGLLFMLVPVLILAGYQLYTYFLYGQGHLLGASSYAMKIRYWDRQAQLDKAVAGVAFVGGCMAVALFYMPVIWRRALVFLWIVLSIALAVFALKAGQLGNFRFLEAGLGWRYAVQAAIMIAAGLGAIMLVLYDLVLNRDRHSMLLAMWVFGTLAFAIFVNWTINARAVLPIAPVLGILIARTAERNTKGKIIYLPLLPAVVIALIVAYGDYRQAVSAKEAAQDIMQKYSGKSVWFEGHWGFQYYMESLGARPLSVKDDDFKAVEIAVMPINNTNLWYLPRNTFRLEEEIQVKPSRIICTMNAKNGAGFYAGEYGPLPFAFLPPFGESYQVYYSF